MIKTEKEGLLQLLKIATPFIIISTVYTIFVLALEEYFGDLPPLSQVAAAQPARQTCESGGERGYFILIMLRQI